MRRAILKGVKVKRVGGIDGLTCKSEECNYISFGGVVEEIDPDSELFAFMQEVRLSDTLEITIIRKNRES